MYHYKFRSTRAAVTLQELRELLPNTYVPDDVTPEYLNDLGIDVVYDAPTMAHTDIQTVVRDAVILGPDNKWIYTWKLEALPTITINDIIASKISSLLQHIDRTESGIYLAVIGTRESEYVTAESQSLAFKSNGYAGTAPPYVASYADARQLSARWAADDILANASIWRQAQEQLRAKRLAAKAQARVATDSVTPDNIKVSWDTFIVSIRALLGI